MDEFIVQDDLNGLKKYYFNQIRPLSNAIVREGYVLEDLSRLNVKEIKSIIFNKLSYAQRQDINVAFEQSDSVDSFAVDTIDLVIILGIILDNAIDETEEQSDGEILCGLLKDGSSTTFIFQNSLTSEKVPVWKMKQKGFSTKGTGRGIGLFNLSKLVDRHENLFLETSIHDHQFIQKVVIMERKNDD